MKQHDEKIYRRSSGKPTLEALRSQLARCKEDYQRFATKEVTSELRQALKAKITALEAEIAQATKSEALSRPAPDLADDGDDSDYVRVPPPATGGPHRAAVSRAAPPRFRPRRTTP